jgi:hypothetical protein
MQEAAAAFALGSSSPPVVAAWLTEARSRRHGDLVVVAHVRTAGPRQ